MIQAMHDYSEHIESPAAEEFRRLEQLTRDMHAASKVVIDLEKQLEKARQEFNDISERQLPDMMDRLGLAEFRTSSGLRVRMKESIHASIPKTRHDEAMKWLDDNGFGGLIKRDVTVRFTREQEEQAHKLAQTLAGSFPAVLENTKVESSTLRAFVNEQLRNGASIPLDLFGIFRRRTVQVGT